MQVVANTFVVHCVVGTDAWHVFELSIVSLAVFHAEILQFYSSAPRIVLVYSAAVAFVVIELQVENDAFVCGGIISRFAVRKTVLCSAVNGCQYKENNCRKKFVLYCFHILICCWCSV